MSTEIWAVPHPQHPPMSALDPGEHNPAAPQTACAEAQATLDRVRAVANEEWGWNRAVALQRALHDALNNPDSEWGKQPEEEEDEAAAHYTDVTDDPEPKCPSWLPQEPSVPHKDRERCAVKGPHSNHTAGLTDRYYVERLHDRKGKHTDCRYFVLDPLHDPLARIALAAYADAAERTVVDEGPFRRRNLRTLAADLRAWLRRIEAGR